MDDGPPGRFSPSSRLERLRRHQYAWDTLKWTTDTKFDMMTGHVWELYGGVLAQAEEGRRLSFRQLPSSHRGIEEKSWLVDISDIDLRDFSMDPSQDLLVIAEKPRLE